MDGAHTHGHGGGDPRVILAVIGTLWLVGSGAATAIASAIVTAIIIIASTIALAAVAGLAFLIWRARQERPPLAFSARPAIQAPPAAPARLERSHTAAPREIDSGQHVHLHFGDMDPASVAEVIRHIREGNRDGR